MAEDVMPKRPETEKPSAAAEPVWTRTHYLAILLLTAGLVALGFLIFAVRQLLGSQQTPEPEPPKESIGRQHPDSP